MVVDYAESSRSVWLVPRESPKIFGWFGEGNQPYSFDVLDNLELKFQLKFQLNHPSLLVEGEWPTLASES